MDGSYHKDLFRDVPLSVIRNSRVEHINSTVFDGPPSSQGNFPTCENWYLQASTSLSVNKNLTHDHMSSTRPCSFSARELADEYLGVPLYGAFLRAGIILPCSLTNRRHNPQSNT
uniref:Uncharacterized protein n=1 Tax=Romanomermis culicivorax TaxID=13658 RepID=A0A915KA77_ROMCU